MSAKLTGHVVSHTHWDRAWYWTLEETRPRLLDLMDGLLELLERDSSYRHFVLDGQMAMVEDYLTIRPECRQRIASLARAGRLLLGPFYVLPDLFIPSGESLLRNLMLGRAAAEALGPVMQLGYLPDPFGLPAQLPQVLTGFEIDGVLFSRGMGDEGDVLGADFFWEGPDGSRVLATHQVGGGYCNLARLCPDSSETSEADAIARVNRLAKEMLPACPHGQLLLNNGCDHLRPEPGLPALLRRLNGGAGRSGAKRALSIPTVRLVHSTPLQYQRAVRRAIAAGRFEPGTHRGELRGSRYANLLAGVLSSRVDLKLRHHEAEAELLRWAEPWLALTRALGVGPDDRALLAHAWRLLLLCQPHDDICGCSIDAVHDDDLNRMARAAQSARAIGERAVQALAGRSRSARRPADLVVLNPHPWQLRAIVLVEGSPRSARTATGLARAQRIEGGTLLQLELPPLGYLPLSRSTSESDALLGPEAAQCSLSGDEAVLRNGLLEARLDKDGTVHLQLYRPAIAFPGAWSLFDEGDAGDTYDFSPPAEQSEVCGLADSTTMHVVERGPLRAAVELRGSLLLPTGLSEDRRTRLRSRRQSPVILRLTLCQGSPVLELDFTLANTADDHRLRAAVSLPFRCREVVAGAPFQVSRRPLTVLPRPHWQQPPSPTQPFAGFAAAEGSRGGIALLAPGLRELEVRPNRHGAELLVTLLRSVRWLSRDDLRTRQGHAGPAFQVQGARQLGSTALRLGLLPYPGTWREAAVARRCEEHACPPRTVPVADVELGPGAGFLELEPAEVFLSSLVPGPEGTVLARLVNLVEEPVVARLRGPFASARRVNLAGRALSGKVDLGHLPLRACEIATLQLELNASPG